MLVRALIFVYEDLNRPEYPVYLVGNLVRRRLCMTSPSPATSCARPNAAFLSAGSPKRKDSPQGRSEVDECGRYQIRKNVDYDVA
jgi:hypothetical protein